MNQMITRMRNLVSDLVAKARLLPACANDVVANVPSDAEEPGELALQPKLKTAFANLVLSAVSLSRLRDEQITYAAFSVLFQQIYDEVLDTAALLEGIDMRRFATDAAYAESCSQEVEVAHRTAKATFTLCNHMAFVLSSHAELISARAQRLSALCG